MTGDGEKVFPCGVTRAIIIICADARMRRLLSCHLSSVTMHSCIKELRKWRSEGKQRF